MLLARSARAEEARAQWAEALRVNPDYSIEDRRKNPRATFEQSVRALDEEAEAPRVEDETAVADAGAVGEDEVGCRQAAGTAASTPAAASAFNLNRPGPAGTPTVGRPWSAA